MNALRLNENYSVEELGTYISEIIEKESGNILDSSKQSMVLSRLKRRLLDLGGLSPQEYRQHLESNYKREITHLVSLLTTHHTFFFREFCHFEFIEAELHNIIQRVRDRGEKKIKIFSAGCSKGHEVYSLAMFLSLHLKRYPGIDFEILGTDIDPASVKVSKNGVYMFKEVKSIPQIYLSGNWQRGTGDISRFARVKKEIKSKCRFDVMNLLGDFSEVKNQKFDIVFCRNVFIYFNQKDIFKIVSKFQDYIHKGGYLITGLSESLKSLDLYKQTHGPSIYSFDKLEEVAPEKIVAEVAAPQVEVLKSIIPKPIKMLVVDDSSSVVKLLTRIFSSDPDFEVVGSAMNGIEAADFVKDNKVDAMTLDIHMPEMDGVEYLKKNFGKTHPKVVVVSSASREDSRYAQETLRFGASDFVEKPALNNIKERAEEIKNKIKMSFYNDNKDISLSDVDKSFSHEFTISDIDMKARVLIGSYSDLPKIEGTLNALEGSQPPVCVFFEGNKNFLDIIKSQLKLKQNIEVYESGAKLKESTVYLCDFKTDFPVLKETFCTRTVSFSIFGICSATVEQEITTLENFQLLLEDTPDINMSLREVATDIFPWTSFAHIATEFLGRK